MLTLSSSIISKKYLSLIQVMISRIVGQLFLQFSGLSKLSELINPLKGLSQKAKIQYKHFKVFFLFYYPEYEIQIDFLKHQIHSDIAEKTQIDHEFKD
jgi:hypothetical protein